MDKKVEIALDDLIEEIESLTKERDYYKKRIEDYNKDEEIQNLKNKINDIFKNGIGFLSEKETENKKQFVNEHWKTCKGNTSLEVYSIGIGSVIKIKCLKCGTVKDITDDENW